MTAGLILKRAPIGWNQDDFDVVESGVIVGRISCRQPRRRIGRGCGRVGTTASWPAPRTAMSRRARRR